MILDGLDKHEAARRFWCVDRNGLLVESMGNALRHAQMAYARPDEEVKHYKRENESQEAIRLLDGKLFLLFVCPCNGILAGVAGRRWKLNSVKPESGKSTGFKRPVG